MTAGDPAGAGNDPVRTAARAIAGRIDEPPEVLLTLGSGLSVVAEAIDAPRDIPVGAVPGLPAPAVPGHTGLLRGGRLAGVPVLVQLGRVHLYEGYSPAEVTRVVAVAAQLGCATYVVTNAAGGLSPDQEPGDLAMITDQLNLTGASPATGTPPYPVGERPAPAVFVDMTDAYDAQLRGLASSVAREAGVGLREGVYAGVRGPAYETPAEAAMLRLLGADLVGMSTVLEVIAARRFGMRVLGLSVITNVHGRGEPASHEEILTRAERAGRRLAPVLLALAGRLPGR